MGKGDKRHRSRAKKPKALAGLELAETPKRDKNGCFADRVRQQDPDPHPQQVALEARARQMGSDKIDDMRSQALTDAAGRALTLSCEPDAAKELTALYGAYIASYRRYMLRCIGLSPDAKVAKIEMTPDRMETRADDRPDLRSEDEKDRDAANSWARYHTALGRLSLADRSYIEGAGRDWVVLVDAGEVTAAGKRFVAAMERFAGFVE